MIISHKYRFIFIKTHKTAGSSIELALARLCGPEDIVAPMDLDSKVHVPRNYRGEAFLDRLYERSLLIRKLLGRHSSLLTCWYYEHMPAWRVREQIGPEVWNSYYKFCFERNPWDKMVSYYLWKKHGQNRWMPSFRRYVLGRTRRLPLDGNLYFDGDTPLVDEVFEFREVRTMFPQICQRLGIPFDGELPREKANIATNRPRFQDFYDRQTRARVEQLFSREIRLLGYRFEDGIERVAAPSKRAG